MNTNHTVNVIDSSKAKKALAFSVQTGGNMSMEVVTYMSNLWRRLVCGAT
jgi:hypothetical protein